MLTIRRRLLCAGVVLSAGLLSACTAAPAGPADRPAPAGVSLSGSAQRFFSDVEAIESTVMGTPQQRAAAEVADQLREQHALADCMRLSRFQYDIPAIDWVHPHADLYQPSWWARPSSAAAAQGMGYAVTIASSPARGQQVTAYDRLPAAQKVAYDAALDRCFAAESATPVGRPQLRAALDLTESLHARFASALTVASFTPVRRTYAACMKSAGYAVNNPDELDQLARDAVGRTGLNMADPHSNAFPEILARARTAETHIILADVGCRSPLADSIARTLQPVVQAWQTANQQRVTAVARSWQTFN